MHSPVEKHSEGSPSFGQPLSIRIFQNNKSHRKLINSFDKNDSHPVKRHQKWKGKNIFLCGGRIMLGVHWSHLLGTIAQILLSWIQYTLLIIPFLHWDVLYLVALLLCTVNLALLLSVACTDPGILPRQHFRNEKSASTSIIRKDTAALRSNFCKICNVWRPSRARHCKYCDNCVDIFDHHCPWTGTCIGMRNYPQFFAFVSSVLVSALFILASAVYILLGWILVGATTDMPVLRIIALGTTIPWCCTMLFLVGTLLAFHVYLMYKGQTTNEYFRENRALRRAPTTPSVPTEGSSRAAGSCCQSAIPWSSTASISRQVTTSDEVYNSINTTAEGEDAHVPTSPGQIDQETASLQLSMNDVNDPTTTMETKDSMLYTVTQDMLQTTTDLLLTPLFDAEATPFPLLSPSPMSPQSPESLQYSDAPAHPPFSSARRTPPREPLDISITPVADRDADIESQEHSAVPPRLQSLHIQARSSLSGHRPQLSLTLPVIEEVKSESDRSVPSILPSHDMITQDSAVPTSASATSNTSGKSRCTACTIVCLPCYAVALAVEQGGCLRTTSPDRQQGHCIAADYYSMYSYRYSADIQSNVHNNAVPQASPDRTPTQQNSRYTYHYFCGCVPIIPHSRLLPMWQWEDEQDAVQQEALLEVLFGQLRVALRKEALDSEDFSV